MTSQQSLIDDDDAHNFCDRSAEEVTRMRQELEDMWERDRDRPRNAGWVRVDLSDTSFYLYRPSGVPNPSPQPLAIRTTMRQAKSFGKK
jgi:hypothetical protein